MFLIFIVIIYEETNYNDPTLELEGKSKRKLIDYGLTLVRSNHIVDINWRTSLISALITSFILSYFLFFPFVVPPDGISHLGDVVISYPQAAIQANEHQHSPEKELAILITHGVLHLLGYDHDVPEREYLMKAREMEVLYTIEGELK